MPPTMVRIAISQAAFDAIAATLPLGAVGFENARAPNGDWFIWLPHHALAKLKRLRGPSGELQRRDCCAGGGSRGAVRSMANVSPPNRNVQNHDDGRLRLR
jgi:hypothetical protein